MCILVLSYGSCIQGKIKICCELTSQATADFFVTIFQESTYADRADRGIFSISG